MQKDISSTFFLALALALLPLAVWAEQTAPKVWQQRLIIPEFEYVPNFHTPRHTDGTYLPPAIRKDTVFSQPDNPLILPARTRIEQGASLTLGPGVKLYAHEHAYLDVLGKLILNGSPDEPILITTNELHPQNQTWSGIITQTGSSLIMNHVEIRYASPAVSCLKNSRADIRNSRIRLAALGIYSETPACNLTDTKIHGVRKSIVANY